MITKIGKKPRTNTKSKKILESLKRSKKSMYRIAKENDTSVSLVKAVKERYLQEA